MTQNYTILFFILFGCLLTSCSNKENTQLNQTIERAIKLAEDRPDKALTILDSIGTPKSSDKKNFMLYQIAQVRARRNSGLPLDSTLIENITLAVKYFEKRKDAKNAAIANFYAARAYAYQGNTESEFYYYLKALPYAEAAKDSTTMSKSLFNLGCVYYNQLAYDSAIVYLKKSIPTFVNQPHLETEAYRILALSYLFKGDLNQAIAYMNEGTPLLDKIGNTNNIYVYNYNVLRGAIDKTTGKYEESAIYLSKNWKPEVPKIEQIRAGLNLTDLYILTQNKDSATYYVQNTIPLLNEMEVKTLDDNYVLLFSYRVLLDYNILTNNNPGIIKYSRLLKNKEDEIDQTNLSRQFFFRQNEIAMQRIEDLNKEHKKKFIIYTVIFSFLAFSTFLAFMYKYLKKEEPRSIHQKINEIEMLQSKLNSMRKNQDLEQSF